jgi:hypothetical protein
MKTLSEQLAQFLVVGVGEGVAREEEASEENARAGCHTDPVASGEPRVGQDVAELILDVLVLRVVALAVELLKGSLIALVHEKELALDQHLVDHLVQECAPPLEGDRFVARHGGEGALAELVEPHMEGHEDVLFGLKVVVQGRFGDAESLGDLAEAGALITLVDEEIKGDVEDELPGRGGRGAFVVVSGPGPSGLGWGRPPARSSSLFRSRFCVLGHRCLIVGGCDENLLDGR